MPINGQQEQEPDRTLDMGDARRALGATMLAASAPALFDEGAQRVLGAQRFYHGTSHEAAKGIRDKGLLASFGGVGQGTTEAFGSKGLTDNAKGHVFISTGPHGKMLSGAQGNLAEALKQGINPNKARELTEMGIGPTGHLFEGAMPYDRFKTLFEKDPDWGGHPYFPGFRSRQDVPAEMMNARGLRGLWSNRASNVLEYMKANKGRTAAGAGLLAGTALAGYGAYRLAKPTVQKLLGRGPQEEPIQKDAAYRYGEKLAALYR